MNEKEESTDKAEDPEDELISALPKESLEILVERGALVPFMDAHGTIRYRIPSGFNRLSTGNYRRRD
jgi:hypothetical protein